MGPICAGDNIQYSGKVVAISEYDFYVRDEKGNVWQLRVSDFRGKKVSANSN